MARFSTRFGTLAMLALLCGAGPVAAEEAASDRTRVAPPLNPSGQSLDPDGEEARRAGTFGEEQRRLTQVTEAEAAAADPEFRGWVDRIRRGLADKPTMRLWWFHRWRLDPFDAPVPEGWRERGHAALRDDARTRTALLAFEDRLAAAAPPSAPAEAGGRSATPGISPWGRWVPIGPWTIPGRATGLDRPAGEPNTLYVSVADGGVWRTRDGGASWEPLSDFEQTLSGGAVLLDPTDPNIIYFGTGEGNGAIDNYPGIGVLKSTDAGLTWTKSNNFSNAVRRLAIHPSEPTRIWAAGQSGCYVSTDAGANFSLLSGVGLPTNAGASDVLVRPDDADVVFCAIWGGGNGGIYRSTNRGASWSLLTNGLPSQGTVGRISLAISKSNPNVLVAGIDQSNGTVYKTTDGGDSWASLPASQGYCGGQCWYDNVVGIDAADSNVLYAGGVGHRRSTDGGATWGPADSGVHVDHHFILTPTPDEVILANDGGVYRSTDRGTTWSNWGLGMDTTQYYGICRHPSDAYWVFGGTQDNGSHRRRAGDNPEWQQRLGGDGGMCMTGPPGSNVVVGEYQNHNMQRSANDGGSFGSANGGIGGSEPRPWVGILLADESNRSNMWTTTNRVYRSLDARATNWASVSGPLYFGLTASTIAVAPSDSNVVYVGYEVGGLYRTANALASTGVSWSSIRPSYLPQRAVRRLRVHPSSADTVFAVFAGYGAGKIWKTTDGGGSWVERTGNLPDVPVNDLVIDADNPGTIIAATDLGVFRSDDDGATWYGWSTGYPTVSSIELTWDAAADRLRVGTHGRSMWEWREASSSPTAVPDGSNVPGTPMRLDKLGGGSMRVRWDTLGCTAREYNLFYGDLENVANGTYDGALCDLGAAGRADVTIPSTASGNVFFVMAAADGQGSEGPHAFTDAGVPTAAHGIGLCGITSQIASATCP